MNVLVTGHKGFIGSRMLQEIKRFVPNVNTIEGDILGAKINEKYDIIYHLAAKRRNESNFQKEYNVTMKICSMLRPGGQLRYASTFMVYQDNQTCLEGSPLNPIGEYGKWKLKCEEYIKQFVHNPFIFRLGHVYGEYAPHGFIKTAFDTYKRNETLELYDGGNVKMNFVHVNDVVQGMRTTAKTGIFNLGGENRMLETVANWVGVDIKKSEKAGAGFKNIAIVSTKAISAGWMPQGNLRKFIEKNRPERNRNGNTSTSLNISSSSKMRGNTGDGNDKTTGASHAGSHGKKRRAKLYSK
jgi:nucleoside-diphosphate-sugar epimerase